MGIGANEADREAVVWVTDGAAGKAAAKTEAGGAAMGGGTGSTGCRAGAGAVRVTETSGGVGRSGVTRFGASRDDGNFAGKVDGRGATRDNAGVFFTLIAAAATDTGAGTYNCIAIYRGAGDSNGERTCNTSRRMPRWIATLPASEADHRLGAGAVA